MIYLRRITKATTETAVCEAPERTEKYIAAGYTRCTRAAYRVARQAQERQAFDALWGELKEMTRAVGQS